MKKYSIYIGCIIGGILLGYFIFSNSSHSKMEHHHDETSESTQWTCSMHPKVIKNEFGDCPICGMDLVPVKTTTTELESNQFKMTKNAIALANIQTSIVGDENSSNHSILLSGKITENEEKQQIQISEFSGRIEKLFVNTTGEFVKKGQLIATVYSPELVAAQQELLTVGALKDTQPNFYNAIRNKLKLWKLNENDIAKIEETQKVIVNFPIYANISGTVSEKLVAQGESIQKGQTLIKTIDLKNVWTVFDVYEKDIAYFKVGQELLIQTNANTKTYRAKISFIDPVLNTRTRTVALRAVIQNTANNLKPGMFVKGTVALKKDDNNKIVFVPETSVLWTGKRSLVYVKTDKTAPIFEMREVILGKKQNTFYEIINGVSLGDEIVTHGTFTVDAAAQLQGKKSMMNREQDLKKETLSPTIEKQFENVINVYMELKNALINGDTSLAAKKSEIFRKELENIPLKDREQINIHWNILHKTSKGIHKNVDLKQQRKQFQIISDNLIAVVKKMTKIKTPLFIQFCPMANNNNGAYWLSKEKQISNPYFGNTMLTCGETTQIIK